jgi:hypothetical protein
MAIFNSYVKLPEGNPNNTVASPVHRTNVVLHGVEYSFVRQAGAVFGGYPWRVKKNVLTSKISKKAPQNVSEVSRQQCPGRLSS